MHVCVGLLVHIDFLPVIQFNLMYTLHSSFFHLLTQISMNVRGVVLVSIAVLILLEVIGVSAERDTRCHQINTPALVSLCVPIHLWPTNVPVV